MIYFKKIFCCSLIIFTFLFGRAQKTGSAHISFTGIALQSADSAKKVCITEITVRGNKRTKIAVILRELPFVKGDSIPISKLAAEMEQARTQVYNTSLFEMVKIEVNIDSSSAITVNIITNERWYIYPIPQFQLVDRNFNVWYKTFHRSLRRVNYGVKFEHSNLTGNRDKLRLYLINGYSRNILFNYSNPNVNVARTMGFSFGGGYSQNREISYATSDSNVVQFYPPDSIRKNITPFVRQSWFINAGYTIRKGFFSRHSFNAGYTYLKVVDSIILKNPNYFNKPVVSMGFPEISYTFQYTNVDNNLYALKGTTYYLQVVKRGWGISDGLDMFSFEAGLSKYYSLGKNWYSNFTIMGRIKLPFKQSYLNQRALGYGDQYLRGLEYHVVDGVAYTLLRSTLKKKIISFNIPFRLFPKLLTKIPFTFFAKTYADFGYVYNKPKFDTYLSNRLLYTGGFGIDLLTLYDINLRFEYSFNQLKKSGLFFHTQSGF